MNMKTYVELWDALKLILPKITNYITEHKMHVYSFFVHSVHDPNEVHNI